MTSPHVTQAMIDAYYEYTHLTLDRRKFVNKLRAMTEPDAAVQISYPFLDLARTQAEAEGKRPQ